jgi:thiamine biosynthesis lipoprotein
VDTSPSDEDSGGNGADGGQTGELLSFSAFLFDTYIEVRAVCEQALLDSMGERLAYFEERFSRTREGSDIYRLNTAGGAPTEVSVETADLINQSLECSALSDGLFDISIGAVSELWDFKEGIVPSPDVLAEAVSHVDYRAIEVTGTTVTLGDSAARLDLGGIAKGYAADEMARMLRDADCQSALIDLGGNIFALGYKPDGEPWSVGIQDPFLERGALKAIVAAHDLSVVTSGPYERSFELDGTRYHHILDPRTGYPVQTDLASASIISTLSIDGDALTTCCFLLGREAAYRLAEERPGVDALLVGEDGSISLTDDTLAELL